MSKPFPLQPRPFLQMLNSATTQVLSEHDASARGIGTLPPPMFQPDLGFIAPGAPTHPQAGGHMYHHALLPQLPYPAMLAIPNSVSSQAMGIGATASAHVPPEAPPPGQAQGDQVSAVIPFAMAIPTTGAEAVSAVKRVSTAFWSLYVKGDWEGAKDVLKTTGETLALIKLPPQPAGVTTGTKVRSAALSECEKAALDEMNRLPLICRAFVMGACLYHGYAPYGCLWNGRLRFERSGDSSTMDRMVMEYAASFGDTKLRVGSFKAALVHLSWLAPDWVVKEGKLKEKYQKCLASALTQLSKALSKARNDLELVEVEAFDTDLLSAVRSSYCSPLLALKLARLTAFRQCGDGLIKKLADVAERNGPQIFPLGPNPAKGDDWDMRRRREAQEKHGTKKANGAARKRRRDDSDEEVVSDPDERQRRPRRSRANRNNRSTSNNNNAVSVAPHPLQPQPPSPPAPDTFAPLQTDGHTSQGALAQQIPEPALDVIASSLSPAPQIETPFDEVRSTVKSAGDVFKSLHLARDWVGARGVLERLAASLAFITQKPQRPGFNSDAPTRGRGSPLMHFAVARLKELELVYSAFAMGACHYHDASSYSSWWSFEMRFQQRHGVGMINSLVEHYAQFFEKRSLRARAFKATLVHVSWLTPDWRSTLLKLKQSDRLASALATLSDALIAAYDGLEKSPIEEAAFHDDLLSAVCPAFCSPLLAPKLAELPAFQQCGDGLALNVAHVVDWQGPQLFPLQPNSAKGNGGESLNLERAQAVTPAPEKATHAAEKRQRERDAEEEFAVDHPPQRLRVATVIDLDRQTHVAPMPTSPALEPEAMVVPPQSAVQMPALADIAAAIQFRIPAHAFATSTLMAQGWPMGMQGNPGHSMVTLPAALAPRMAMTPSEAPRPQTFERWAQQQQTSAHEPILPGDQASANDPVRTPALRTETPMPADPAMPDDLFDLFDWGAPIFPARSSEAEEETGVDARHQRTHLDWAQDYSNSNSNSNLYEVIAAPYSLAPPEPEALRPDVLERLMQQQRPQASQVLANGAQAGASDPVPTPLHGSETSKRADPAPPGDWVDVLDWN